MKSIVVYSSKTGFTKRYAEIISKELDCSALALDEAKKHDLTAYDQLIYGGSLYASGVLGLKKMLGIIGSSDFQKVVVFGVGATSYNESLIDELISKNYPKGQPTNHKFFYLRGGFNFNKLNSVDKFLMGMMKKSIEKKKVEDRTEDDKGLLASFDNPVDFVSKESMGDILKYCKED